MKTKELVDMGLPLDCVQVAVDTFKATGLIHTPTNAHAKMVEIIANPDNFVNSEYGDVAKAIVASHANRKHEEATYGNNPVASPSGKAPYKVWGEMDEGTKAQMEAACSIPVAVQGAVMPDSHLGYGLEIGGVLATYNSVIPYAVGVDISCSMKCTITDLPVKHLWDAYNPKVDPLVRALSNGTVFGIGGEHKIKANAPVMDMDWSITEVTKRMKDRAWGQLGTSGSGNHFCSFGIVTLHEPELGLEAGEYVALLSHSGSRGAGAAVCKTYSDIAMGKLPKVYAQHKNLSWLSLDSEAGQEYWAAMTLMYHYALANHETIHQRVCDLAGAKSLAVITNSHNLAWKEVHNGQELIVHRKGATPADEGVLGIIPGSMADPGFIVRGKGNAESLRSASHGAGRCMSRTQAIKTQNAAKWKSILKQRGVRVLSYGLDEVPGCYKNIHDVMKAQRDLVEVIARFDSKLVKMSAGGKAED